MTPSVKDAKLLAGNLRRAAHYERLAWQRRRPIVRGQVLYEAFAGNGVLDNPEAIFRGLLTAPDLQKLSHVWVLNEAAANSPAIQEFDGDPRVRFVRYGSSGYYEALARSEFLINNATFPPEFGKREGQIYINTWHGVPLKNMGYDIPGGGPETRNIVRNFVSADYLLSANEFMTTQMYETSYKLRGIFRGRIVQEGSPRVDRQFVSDTERDEFRARLVAGGLALNPAHKTVVYAPTWRGSFYAPLNDAVQLLNQVRALNKQIHSSGYQVLLKVHQRVYEYAVAQPELRALLVPNDVPTNVMLAATDVLVTDYSSIFFDFLATGRPVLFFAPDEAAYGKTRGLYLDREQLPGPVVTSLGALGQKLRALGQGGPDDALVSHADPYRAAADAYTSHEDGHATDRIIDIVFRGKHREYDVREDFTDGRQSILIHLGGMLSNGITKSALSLLDTIDHDKYDVSAFYAHSVRKDRRANEDAINPQVRLFPRLGGINGSKFLWPGRQVMLRRGLSGLSGGQRRGQIRSLRDEWTRCFGDSKFDYIVDFSGYSPFWAQVLLQGDARSHSVFLHNDLLADSQREVNGRRLHERNLRSIFTTYRDFDNLISVSSALEEINRSQLSAFADPEKFVSAPNTCNYPEILRMARGTAEAPAAAVPSTSPATFTADSLPEAIAALRQRYSIDAIAAEVGRQDTIHQLVPPIPDAVTFVTASRLSPEKNHARLIRAFDLVHRDNPNTRLVIMGDGPLRLQLDELIVELGLLTAVTLAGRQDNPYGVMAKANCFVMSSDYEGQPMVFLEAMALGIPIVTTNFASVRGALPEGYGLVVAMSVEALASGMRAYLEGDVPAPAFDYVAYNEHAVQQFYQAIGVN
jgi:CDP-glycerol glycerophosphotransferase